MNNCAMIRELTGPLDSGSVTLFYPQGFRCCIEVTDPSRGWRREVFEDLTLEKALEKALARRRKCDRAAMEAGYAAEMKARDAE